MRKQSDVKLLLFSDIYLFQEAEVNLVSQDFITTLSQVLECSSIFKSPFELTRFAVMVESTIKMSYAQWNA